MRRKPLGERTGRLVDPRSQTRYGHPYGGSLRGALTALLLAALLPVAFASPALAGGILAAVAAGRLVGPAAARRFRAWIDRRRTPGLSEARGSER